MVCGWSVGEPGVTVCTGVVVWASAGAAQADSTSILAAASMSTDTDLNEVFMVFSCLRWSVARPTRAQLAIIITQTALLAGRVQRNNPEYRVGPGAMAKINEIMGKNASRGRR